MNANCTICAFQHSAGAVVLKSYCALMQYLHSHQIIHFDIKVSMQVLIVLAYVISLSAWLLNHAPSKSCWLLRI